MLDINAKTTITILTNRFLKHRPLTAGAKAYIRSSSLETNNYCRFLTVFWLQVAVLSLDVYRILLQTQRNLYTTSSQAIQQTNFHLNSPNKNGATRRIMHSATKQRTIDNKETTTAAMKPTIESQVESHDFRGPTV